MAKKIKHRSAENELRSKIVAALRQVWQATSKRDFVKSKRKPHRGLEAYKFEVTCVECRDTHGITQKYRVKNTDGRMSKKERIWFQVDHLEGITPFKTLDDLSAYAKDLFCGSMQILCIECHKKKTKEAKSQKEKS